MCGGVGKESGARDLEPVVELLGTEKCDGSLNLMGTYWTPKAILNPASAELQDNSPVTFQKATLGALKGAWEHSSLSTGVVVDGDDVLVGKKRHKLRVSRAGLVEAVCGYTLQRYDGSSINWLAADESGHVCTWTRKQVLPKRKRNASDKLAEASQHAQEVTKWLSNQRRGLLTKSHKKLPKTKELPKGKINPGEKLEPKPPDKVIVTDAELRRLTKALQRREKSVPKDKDERGRGFTTKVKNADSDEEEEQGDAPGWLQQTEHRRSEWAGWHRLTPHSLCYQAMEHLSKEGFPIGKLEKKHSTPSKFAVEILARAPVLTNETARQCRASSECTEFLSEHCQEAWPSVTRKLMHTHVASNKCATYTYSSTNEIEAAAVLKVKEKNQVRICKIEFIRAARKQPPATPKVTRNGHKRVAQSPDGHKQGAFRPVPAFMDAIDSKLGPVFDKLVLQVHSTNKHALERFGSKYGFVRDTEYDQAWTGRRGGRGVDYRLLGMSKEPRGKALELAKARQKAEGRKRERCDSEPKDSRKTRPKRAAAKKVDYRDPEDPGITVEDLVMR